mmetsp:Transcript_5677/g.16021  ORF Transcript_5677/g.16021 Transcript_5677/m.16021 type:complete len:208 (+) Transcript_5677:57-680(+)
MHDVKKMWHAYGWLVSQAWNVSINVSKTPLSQLWPPSPCDRVFYPVVNLYRPHLYRSAPDHRWRHARMVLGMSCRCPMASRSLPIPLAHGARSSSLRPLACASPSANAASPAFGCPGRTIHVCRVCKTAAAARVLGVYLAMSKSVSANSSRKSTNARCFEPPEIPPAAAKRSAKSAAVRSAASHTAVSLLATTSIMAFSMAMMSSSR